MVQGENPYSVTVHNNETRSLETQTSSTSLTTVTTNFTTQAIAEATSSTYNTSTNFLVRAAGC